jgi:hypothetical protein
MHVCHVYLHPSLHMYGFQEGLTFGANIERAPTPTNSQSCQTRIWVDEAIFIFQPLKSVVLFLRESSELMPPSAIFFFARRAISFSMNSSSKVVRSHCLISSQTRSRLFHFGFSAEVSCNCNALSLASSGESVAGGMSAYCCGPSLYMSDHDHDIA